MQSQDPYLENIIEPYNYTVKKKKFFKQAKNSLLIEFFKKY